MRTSDTGRYWRLFAMVLVSGSTLLALASGDLLLILATVSATGGMALLTRPATASRAATTPKPRLGHLAGTVTGTADRQLPQTLVVMEQRRARPRRLAPSAQVQRSEVSPAIMRDAS